MGGGRTPSGRAEADGRTAEVEVWVADSVASAELEREGAERLAPDEIARARRFARASARRNFVAARALAREVLSRATGVPPRAWRFATGGHGKPEIAAPTSARELAFNLSHTDGMVAFAWARSGDVGVDVEHTGRSADALHLAERFFAPSEHRALRSLAEPARRDRFFALWTLKEAVLKARGVGLATSTRDVWFEWRGEEPVRVLGVESGGHWRLRSWLVGRSHRLAVAVRCGRGGPAAHVRLVRWSARRSDPHRPG